ncbi:SAM-dependent methyltransferase [Deinococcus sp. MIMF12]|uniref:SAM-dependent methyltransferase n=1 Tax=Deinococcus rhizophilus TaxID=3049544 RepID=A0ABT7JQD7_9DEIO|nr:SAM-dependent methyltransferase [Deinococcus rhizophilus]MDL2345859.1 SAM-dependent methyltransferase [Deinococcus rhizophilus]
MIPPDESLTDAYFEDVYRASDDPWNFETSEYERAKYARTLAALPRDHYARALEVGCSIGVLTGLLSERAGALLSVDVSERALARARERNRDRANVTFGRRRLPAETPPGPFDLIVLSEVGYYFSTRDLEAVLDRLTAALAPGGDLILVHWTPPVPDYPQTGDAVHGAALRRTPAPLQHRHAERHEHYRLDVLSKPGT